jgi:hypothetical protein
MPEAVQEWVVAFGQWLYDRSGAWEFEQPVPKTLYKYWRAERVHVLRDCSVRFSQRTVFEDEGELRPEVAAFGTEEEIRAYLAFNPWDRPSEVERCSTGNSDEHDRISRHDCGATTTALAV